MLRSDLDDLGSKIKDAHCAVGVTGIELSSYFSEQRIVLCEAFNQLRIGRQRRRKLHCSTTQ